tara:strand:+ start:163 stop:810 length:648 start_codon:yes stop_codon:yes gene_type:complete
MKNFIPYLLVVISTIIFTFFLLHSENKIKELEQQTHTKDLHRDSLNNCIDSLIHEIDTLIWESEIWDYNKYESIDTTIVKWPWGREEIYYFKYKNVDNSVDLLNALIFVESSGNDSAYNASEDAVGCLQIRQCMVNDVNRILKRQGKTKRFHYEDRWCRIKSVEIFDIVCKHYGWNTAEEIARCWNGGPRGINNPATAGYWNKVQNKLEENYALR